VIVIDCPSTTTRDRQPPWGYVAGVTLNESAMAEIDGRPAIRKDKATLYALDDNDLDTGRPVMEAQKARTPFVLLNAESRDAGSPEYAQAVAATARAIRDATGAKFAVYNHFGWERPDAGERWLNMCRAYAHYGVAPEFVLTTAHWRGRSRKQVLAGVEMDTKIIRQVEPGMTVGALVCPYDYATRTLRLRDTDALTKLLWKRSIPVARWYEPGLVPVKGAKR
jgi:hypothetical protein